MVVENNKVNKIYIMAFLFVGIITMTIFGYSFASSAGNDYVTVIYTPGECGAFETQTFLNVPRNGPIPEFDMSRLENNVCHRWEDDLLVPCSREDLTQCMTCEFQGWHRTASAPSSPFIEYEPLWGTDCHDFSDYPTGPFEVTANISVSNTDCRFMFHGNISTSDGSMGWSTMTIPTRTELGYIFRRTDSLFAYPNTLTINVTLPRENFRGSYTVDHNEVTGTIVITVLDDPEYCNGQEDGPYLGMSPDPTPPEPEEPAEENPDEIITEEEESTPGNIISNIPDTLANIPLFVYLIGIGFITLGIIIFIKNKK